MKKILLALSLLAAAPAYAASPLVQCLSGCPGTAQGKLKADTQIADQWWLGPSVGLALAARDNATGTWESNIALQFAYGIHWRPAFWTATPTFLSLNLGLQAGTSNVANPNFVITVAPTLQFFDLIAFGFGPRFHFTDGTSISGVTFIGLSTSFGGP